MKNKILILILVGFIFGSCNQEKYNNVKSNRFENILQTNFPKHFPNKTVDAIIIRTIIGEYVIKKDTNDLKTNYF